MKNYSAIIIYTDYLLTEEADNLSENMLEIFEVARLYAEKADAYGLEKGFLKALSDIPEKMAWKHLNP